MSRDESQAFQATSNARIYVIALVVGPLIWFIQHVHAKESVLGEYFWGVAGASLSLTVLPLVESFGVAATSPDGDRLDRVLYSFWLSYFAVVSFAFAQWIGPQDFPTVLTAIGIGTLIGTGFSLSLSAHRYALNFQNRFHDETPDLQRMLSRALPALLALLLFAYGITSSAFGWSDMFLMLNLVLWPAVVLRLRPKDGLGLCSPDAPRILGVVLLIGYALTSGWLS